MVFVAHGALEPANVLRQLSENVHEYGTSPCDVGTASMGMATNYDPISLAHHLGAVCYVL